MKKLLLFSIMIIGLTSCTDSREKLVSDYEQNILGTKTDLSLNVIEIKDGNPITANDSLKFYGKEWEDYFWENSPDRDKYPNRSNKDSVFNNFTKQEAKITPLIEKLKRINTYESRQLLDDLYEANNKIKETKDKINFYKKIEIKYKDKNRIIYKTFTATYTIKNPFLNGVKQTLTKTYYVGKNGEILGIIN